MILVIEDFAPQRHVRKRTLEKAGFSVREAASAAEARQIIATELPHAVVSDVGLGDENGITLCSEIKRAHPTLPVVMVTESYRGAQVRRDAIAAGADAFLSEPVPAEQLVRIVSNLVDDRNKP